MERPRALKTVVTGGHRRQLSLFWPSLIGLFLSYSARTPYFSLQDPVHSWKAGRGEVMTVENLFIDNLRGFLNKLATHGSMCAAAMAVLTCAATQGLSNQTCITV